MKKGIFTSVWNRGTKYTIDSLLNIETGEIIGETINDEDNPINDEDNLEYLEVEYFTDEQDNKFIICPICHKFIMRIKMFEGYDKKLKRRSVCSNPLCETNDCYSETIVDGVRIMKYNYNN